MENKWPTFLSETNLFNYILLDRTHTYESISTLSDVQIKSFWYHIAQFQIVSVKLLKYWENRSTNSFTVKILKFRTPKKFAVIALKVEQDDFSSK